MNALPRIKLHSTEYDEYTMTAQIAWLNGLLDEPPMDAALLLTELEEAAPDAVSDLTRAGAMRPTGLTHLC